MAKRRYKIDRRLLGTWRSDKKLTLREWAFSAKASPNQKAHIRSLFGTFTMRYSRARVFTNFKGNKTMCLYEVIASDDDSVAILRHIEEGRVEIQHIHFIEPDIHWVCCGRNREFFRRIDA